MNRIGIASACVVSLVAAVGLLWATPALGASVPSTGTQHVLLIRATWDSVPSEPSDTTAAGLAGDVQEWFSTVSHGALTVETTASEWVHIGGPTTGCQA